MLAETEEAIARRIETALAPFQVSVSPYPSDVEQQAKPIQKGMILIGYKRSRFREISYEPMVCEMICEFEVSLMLRDLRSHVGAYPILDMIRYAITGFIPLKGPSGKCYPIQEGFVDIENGIWRYAMSVGVALRQTEGQQPYSPSESPDIRPYSPSQIQIGIHRSVVDNQSNNAVDRTISFNVEQA